MQKPKALFIIGASLFVIAGMLALKLLSQPSEKTHAPSGVRPSPEKSPHAASSSTPLSAHKETTADSDLAPENPEETATAREKILEEIQDAAVSYDAVELPKIEPYLLHPDQEIRQAAMNGMVILGDQAAGPLLRKAAEQAPTPQEAVALLEAADYVELPSGTLRRRSK